MNIDLTSIQLPTTVALSLVAAIGYAVGRFCRPILSEADIQSRREIKRAQAVARDLEKVANQIRESLDRHRTSLDRFKHRVRELGISQNESAWKELCREADAVLKPTLQLAAQISQAYDEIRQQGHQLLSFTEVRTDALTGICNRRAMEEMLSSLCALKGRYQVDYSLAIFDIDHFKRINDEHGHLHGDRVLQEVAALLDDAARETDMVARYGGEEFVVIMPQTNLAGAVVFSERLRASFEPRLSLTVSGGVAAVQDGDTPELLLRRADAALYEAKKAGRNCIFKHDSDGIEPAVPLGLALDCDCVASGTVAVPLTPPAGRAGGAAG